MSDAQQFCVMCRKPVVAGETIFPDGLCSRCYFYRHSERQMPRCPDHLERIIEHVDSAIENIKGDENKNVVRCLKNRLVEERAQVLNELRMQTIRP